MRQALLAALVVVLLTACGASGTGTGVGAIEPRDGKSGLQLSGTIDGRQFVVNDGAPVLRLGDCDVNDGTDTDLCFFSRELDGGFLGVVMENPAVIEVTTLPVVDPPCVSPHCDDVTDGIVVELQFAPGAPRTRATGGDVVFTVVEDGGRYSGRLNLTFPDGRISGAFEVVPRPEPS